MFRVILGLLLLGAIPAAAAPCVVPVDGKRVEITKQDLTVQQSICSLRLAVLGVFLGQSATAAHEALDAAGFVSNETEAKVMDMQLRYVHVRLRTKASSFLTLTIENDRVTEISLHVAMRARLPGESSLLLDSKAAIPDSTLRLRLLGKEDARREAAGTLAFAYDAEGLDVILISEPSITEGNVRLRLRYPAKQRQ